jgi:protein phosphatase
VDIDIQEIDVQPDDVLLLCSDGRPDMVEDDEIHLTISTFSANLETVGKQLIQLSNDQGGRDNISVILAQVLEPFPAKTGLFSKIKHLFQ